MAYQQQRQLDSYHLQELASQPVVYAQQQSVGHRSQTSTPIPIIGQQSMSASQSIIGETQTQVSAQWPMTQPLLFQRIMQHPRIVDRLQQLHGYEQQASILQPMECQWQTVVQAAIRHQVQSAIRQEKTQWEEFVQAMRVNEDLFSSYMAKVDNENKCVQSEKLNSRMTDESGDTDYKV